MLWVLILVIFAVTAVLTAWEMATFSARVERMRQAALSGDRSGTQVLAYQRSPRQFITALQFLCIAGSLVLGSILSPTAADPLAAWLADLGLEEGAAQSSASLSVLLVATILSLILTNVLPKHIGFVRANEIALFAAKPMRVMINLTRPLGWIVNVGVNLCLKFWRIRPDTPHRVTEADMNHLLQEGVRAGSLDSGESQVIARAFKMSEHCASEIMTPREKLVWVDLQSSSGEINDVVKSSGRSIFLVADGSLDRVEGVIRARDWLADEQRDRGALKRILLPVSRLQPGQSALHALEALKASRSPMLLVEDESGRTLGILTLHDLVRRLLGPLRSA